MDVIQVIKERRSVRKFKPEPVKEEDLNTVLDAARWAPSWGNTQCWRFVVVTDNDLKRKLVEALADRNPSTNTVANAPVVIAACAVLGEAGYYKGEALTDKGDWFMFDVALALSNLTLAAHARGMGTVHVGYFNAEKVEKVLDIPDGVRVVELMPLGYPDEPARGPGRKEISDILFRNKYGNRNQW